MASMEVRSLSYSTLLHLLSYRSLIENKKEYLVVKTPHNPGYYWGNFLFFYQAPHENAMAEWEFLFDQEFMDIPVSHKAFAWDSTNHLGNYMKPFIKKKYYYEVDDVMIATVVEKPNYYNSQLTIKAINSEKELVQACQLNVACFGHGLGNTYSSYVNRLMSDFHKDTEMGRGVWIGAFLKNQLVGDMGLFNVGYQRGLICSVKTDPNHRENGVCRTLLYQAVKYGFEQMGMVEIVLVTDQNYHASTIYRSVGFNKVEQGFSLLKTY